MSMLKVEDLHVYYGSIHAIKGISFQVEEGEVVTLIGANGADEGDDLPFVDVEGDVLDGVDGAIVDVDALYLQNGFHTHASFCLPR